MESGIRHHCESVQKVVVAPIDDSIVCVYVSSGAHIYPKSDSHLPIPTDVPHCIDRHIIRTRDHVLVAEVEARVCVYPCAIPFMKIQEQAKETLLEAMKEDGVTPTPEAFAKGLSALTQRLASGLHQCGVRIT